MASTTAGQVRTERVDGSRILRAALIGGGLAAVVNVVIWAIARFVLGLELLMQMGGPEGPIAPLSAVPVVIASVIPALAAGAFLWGLNRFTRRPYTIFLAIAVVFLLFSFGGPLSLPVDTAMKVALNSMHVGAAIAIVWSLVTQTRAR